MEHVSKEDFVDTMFGNKIYCAGYVGYNVKRSDIKKTIDSEDFGKQLDAYKTNKNSRILTNKHRDKLIFEKEGSGELCYLSVNGRCHTIYKTKAHGYNFLLVFSDLRCFDIGMGFNVTVYFY